MAGYSGTPLIKKLGIKAGCSIFVSQPSDTYIESLNPLPENVTFKDKLTGELDFIHLFVKERKVFEKEFTEVKNI
jgi:hypothetical protein